MNDDHQCPTLEERLPRFDRAPAMSYGIDNYRVISYLLLADIDAMIANLEMLGLSDGAMLEMKEARDFIDSELMCENPVHHEIFEQFLKDGMKFVPALQAAHRV